MLPRNQSAAIELARAAAEIIARRKGEQTVSQESWEEALDGVLGGRVVNGVKYGGLAGYNGQRVVIPANIRKESFEDLVSSITDGDISWLAGLKGNPLADARGREMGIGDLRRAHLVMIGDGRYLLAMGDVGAGDPRYIMNRFTHRPFELDLNRLEKSLYARHPEYYLGGG